MGFFSDLEDKFKGFGRGLEDVAKDFIGLIGTAVDDVASAIAQPLGVHPDVVKVAAAALGMYYQTGGFATAAGEAVSEAAAADLIAAHGAEALAVMGDASAAAELAAATGTALPYGIDPAMLASQLAAEGSIASAAHIASTAGVSTAPIVDSLIASGQYDAAVQLTMATNPMELGFVNQNIGLAKTAAEAATAFPVATSPLAQMGGPNILMDFPANMIDSSLGQAYAELGVGANALAPGAAATGAGVANALSPEALAAYDASVGLTAGGTPATLTPEALAAYDASVGLTAGTGAGAAGAGAAGAGAATNALAGYGGAGDVLDPVTGAVTTGADAAAVAGLGAGAFDTLAKFARDYGVPLSALISGITGSQAARDAANVQAESAREARQLARDIFNEQKALQEPFRTAGIGAQNQLLTLLGLPGGTQGAEFGRYARPFGMQDFQADPGYAFRLSEGMKALEASRAAKGGLLSGATGKALTRYGQDLGSQEYGNAFSRFQTERVNRLQPLGALMGTGQAAASNQGAAAGQYGQTAGALTTDIGAARAAGDVGAANAITNALGQYARYASNQNLANQIRQSLYGAAIPG